MSPYELTVPVQMVFVVPTDDGVVLDCTVASEVIIPDDLRIPDGTPFSLLIAASDDEAGDRVLPRLQQWCGADAVVDAVTFSDNRRVLLRCDSEELLLEVV